MLQELPGLQVIAEASDGLEAVLKAHELQPDLILIDIDLPRLHGIEAARQIRIGSPMSRILFVGQETLADVVQKALSTGACGYLLKKEAGDHLMVAVKTVLRGEKFVSKQLKDPSVP